jgi:hypothetical protein
MNKHWMLFIILIYFTNVASVFSWNAEGHRLVAQIAVNHLTPHAKVRFKAYNRMLSKTRKQSLVEASTWLDKIKYKNSSFSSQIHYIDIPFSIDQTSLPQVGPINAVSAFHAARKTLENSRLSVRKRAIALRVILHLAGDLHQPLHASTRISRNYPEGDRGGNLTLLPDNPVAHSLHAFWDKGAGLLMMSTTHAGAIKQQAARIEARWPCHVESMDQVPAHWAEESHTIAVQDAYRFDEATATLDAFYQRHALSIAEERIASAGCRLAAVLNEIDRTLSSEKNIKILRNLASF